MCHIIVTSQKLCYCICKKWMNHYRRINRFSCLCLWVTSTLCFPNGSIHNGSIYMGPPFSSDVFSSCYRSAESRSFTLLIRKSPVWGGTTCLQMGMSADARLFFSHDGVQVCDCFHASALNIERHQWRHLNCFISVLLISFKCSQEMRISHVLEKSLMR